MKSSATRNFQYAWRLVALSSCLALPVLGFGVAGVLWLHERGWLGWAGLAFIGGEALALWLFRRWVRNDQSLLPQPSAHAPLEFSPREEEAWRLVQEYQDRIERNEIEIVSLEQLFTLGKEILARMARFYQPAAKDPLFAVPVPLLLRAIEETARDLVEVSASLPFAHRITISEMMRGYQLSQKMKPAYELYQLYRFLSPLISPQSGLFRLLVTDRLFDLTKETLNQWLLKWYVDRIGYHAIELYSGKLLLTRRDVGLSIRQPEAREGSPHRQGEVVEPLRLLVLGQVKAGKSSLVNALFGSVRAATDSIPTTRELTPYILERPGLEGSVVLYDMGGYEDPSAPPERKEQAFQEAIRVDLIILVIAAVNAAREPDRQLLADLRAHFATRREMRQPPVVIALTHIDLLRPPLEWSPPYNIVTPDSPKARSIRGAIEAVAADLAMTPEDIAPLCLLPGRLYNVEEALLPLLTRLLPEAKRVLLLRGVKTLRDQEQWELVWRQARASGRFLLEIGREVIRKSVREVLPEKRVG